MKPSYIRQLTPIIIAIFSMFFGAGNTIYPILLAVNAKNQFGWSFFGFLLTAITGPLLGLIGGALFRGRPVDFFMKAGKWPGIILLGASLALLGPFAVLPRCIAVAYAAMQSIIPMGSLLIFAFLFCFVSFLCTYKKKVLLPALGYFLSPTLLACLFLIIYKGWSASHLMTTGKMESLSAFSMGLSTGYDTMDLIASIIFSAGIWSMVGQLYPKDTKKVLKTTLIAGLGACLMLALIYFGLSHAAAIYSQQLSEVPKQELMSQLALLTLGPKVGVAANIAVALACLTTVIGLVMTLSSIISKEILPQKISYKTSVVTILILSVLMTNIGFETISVLIHSVVQICYPLIILLTLYNIGSKLLPSKEGLEKSLTPDPIK